MAATKKTSETTSRKGDLPAEGEVAAATGRMSSAAGRRYCSGRRIGATPTASETSRPAMAFGAFLRVDAASAARAGRRNGRETTWVGRERVICSVTTAFEIDGFGLDGVIDGGVARGRVGVLRGAGSGLGSGSDGSVTAGGSGGGWSSARSGDANTPATVAATSAGTSRRIHLGGVVMEDPPQLTHRHRRASHLGRQLARWLALCPM